MRRELLLIGEMIEAAVQSQLLVEGVDLERLGADRQRRDALLWNFTVLGEAAAQLDKGIKSRFAEVPWSQPVRLRNRVVHAYWSVDIEILTRPQRTCCPVSPHSFATCSTFWSPNPHREDRLVGYSVCYSNQADWSSTES